MQKISKNFYLTTSNYGKRIIFSDKLKIIIQIKDKGFVPKSGFLIVDELQGLETFGRVLDIGTGETGILAHCLYALGASEVVATDIDQEAIKWAKISSDISPFVRWLNCDLYHNVDHDNVDHDDKFDLVVSNPPQMPMLDKGHSHDYGGLDGKDVIIRIIQRSKDILKPQGKLILLCFDFLGVEGCSERVSVFDIAQINGLKAEVLAKHKRVIRKGGKTEENMNWIRKVYPRYTFQKDRQGNYYHEIFILKMSKISHV